MRTNRILLIAFAILCTLSFTVKGFAQTFDEKFELWPVDLKINGRIVVNNGLEDFSAVEQLFERIVKDKQVVSFDFKTGGDESKMALALKEATGDNGDVKSVDLSELQTALTEADVVVLNLGAMVGEHVESIEQLKPALERFIKNGKTLVVDPSIARLLGAKVLGDGSENGQAGLNLLPDCILNFGGVDSGQSTHELHSVLTLNPRLVGINVADATMLMLSGRKFTCYGDGKATFTLTANQQNPMRVESIAPRSGRRQRAQDTLVDLTAWRRDAIDRTLEPFPKSKPDKPFVKDGTLVIVGGGGMPRGLMARFVELAGGVENAKMVYVPCAETDDVGQRQGTVEAWKRMGVKHATFIHTKDRNQSNSDEEFLAPLKEATAVWFGGGRQWNLADSYYGTKAHKLMKDVLKRGGVIGGSSAGASIQGRYLARATPVGNLRIMAPGYERGGLGFLSGVAIDQHFSQRRRQKDMTRLVDRYPQLLGIGIDEATAVIVQESKADIVGRGNVHFYDRNLPVDPKKPDYIALPKGSSYDLGQRKVLVDTRPNSRK